MDWKWLTLGVIILLMVEEGESQISGPPGVCTRYETYRVSTKASIKVKTQTCNRVEGFNRCRDKYVTRYQVEYNTRARRILHCCSGYRSSDNNCYPVCSPTCRNGGTCVKPRTCTCLRGWIGSYCQTPICSPPCRNKGKCTRPDTCSCSSGWRGSICQTRIAICSPPCRNGGSCIRPNTCSCPSGWTGSYCQTAMCSPLCRNGGRCIRPDTCSCLRGWRGSYCQTAVCSPPCRNGGRCTQPDTCSCPRGWRGSYCQTAICTPPCRNGGRCIRPNTCGCPSGWTGFYCQTAVCSPSCRNGGTCTQPDTCRCPSGWSGSYCQTGIAICSPPCRNGGSCIHPNTCSCSTGWTGSYCQTATCNPPCLNGGTCISSGSCRCPPGWFGSTCRSSSVGLSCSSPLRRFLPRLFSHCSGVTSPPPCIYGNWTKWTLTSEIKSNPNCSSRRAWAQTRVRNALTSSCRNKTQEQRKYICQPTQNQTLEIMKRVLRLGKIVETTTVPNQQNVTREKRQITCPEEDEQEDNRICEDVCGKRKRSILSEFESESTGHNIVKIQELDPSIPVEPFHIPDNEHDLRHRRESGSGSESECRYFLFILDSSGSISEEVFTAKKEVLATITKSLCGHIKVAMITYSTDVNLEFCFDCYDSREDIANAILRAPYHKASTRTHNAMKCVHEQLLDSTLCDLPVLAQLDVITLTDGHHNGQCSMTLDDAVDLLHARGNTNLYCIGYGNIDEDGVQDVVKNDNFEHIFLTSGSYDLAYDIAQAIENDPFTCLNYDIIPIPS